MKTLLKILVAGLLLVLAGCDATNSTSEPAATVTSTPETTTTPESEAPAAEKVEGINVAFMVRTKKYTSFQRNLVAKTPNTVILVMRIEGVTLEEFRAEEKPRIEYDGESDGGVWRESSANKTATRNGEVLFSFEPYLLLVSGIPEQAKEVTLIVYNHPPLLITVPAQISEEFSKSDIR